MDGHVARLKFIHLAKIRNKREASNRCQKEYIIVDCVPLIGVESNASMLGGCWVLGAHCLLYPHQCKRQAAGFRAKQASVPRSPRTIIGASIKAEKY